MKSKTMQWTRDSGTDYLIGSQAVYGTGGAVCELLTRQLRWVGIAWRGEQEKCQCEFKSLPAAKRYVERHLKRWSARR